MNQSFSLDPKADLDIIKWLGEQPNVSEAIRTAIRNTMKQVTPTGETPGEVIEMLQGISRQIAKMNSAISKGIITVAEGQERVNPGGEVPDNILKNMRSNLT